MDLQDQLKRLERMKANVPQLCMKAQKIATERAVEAAEEATPPEAGGDLRGVNAVSGTLKRAWREDSQIEPENKGNGTFETQLVNSKEYASFVDNGHRLTKHFVPGLYIDPSTGLLSRNADGKGGMVVGTKTSYVQGLFMTDRAREAYEQTLPRVLEAEIRRISNA